MLQQLIESDHQPTGGVTQAATSLAVHAALVILLVLAAPIGHSPAQPRIPPFPWVLPAPPPVATSSPTHGGSGSETLPSAPIARPVSIPEDGFHLPDFLSTTLPAPDPDWGARAAAQARGLALGRSSDGVLGSLLATNRDSLSEATLPIPLVMPDPIYPPALRAAGIEGRVVIEFVVDGSGRPDSGSIQVLSTDLPPFGEAARQSVLGSRFRPGRSNGRPVAVRVRQVVRFLVK